MDPLSDVLRAVKLIGAYFYLVEAAAPWSVSVRKHVQRLEPQQAGWLAGLRDPVVSAALSQLVGVPPLPCMT